MPDTINYLYIFLAITFAVASQLIIKWKMSACSFSDHHTVLDKFVFAFFMLFNPYIVIALTLTILAQLSWMIAMTKFDISYAYPFTMLGFVLILVLSSLLFKEPVTRQKVIGLILIILGVIISSKSL